MAAEPATALIAKLDQAGIAYELIPHQRTLTAAAEACPAPAAPRARSPLGVVSTRVFATLWGAKNRVPPANPHFSGTRTEF